jgi:ABC-2 type transport system permease protein
MAGIDAAGMDGTGGKRRSGEGLLGAQARAQYAALARLRWHMFGNGLRSTKGAVEVGARIVVFIIYAGMGLGMGTGAGVSTYMLASNGNWQYLPIVFWVLCFIWQVLPIMLASFQEQFDLSCLLRFPVSFQSFFLLYIVFGLVDVSTIVGVFCSTGILIGISVARPDLFLWTLLCLIAFAAFNVLLVRAIFAWIDRWLAQRRTREILTAVFLLLMLSFNLLNPALRQRRGRGHETPQQQAEDLRNSGAQFQIQHNPWLKTANSIQKWLPPGLIAVSLRRAAELQPVPALGSLTVLGAFMVLAGGTLLVRLRGEYRGENLGEAPKAAEPRKKLPERGTPGLSATTLSANAPGFLDNYGPLSALVKKEVRTLMRTLPQLYAVGAPLLLMVILSGALLRRGPGTHTSFAFAVPLCIVYALLGFTQLFYNNLGAEGAGINLLFLSPTPFRTVMLAKNIFHGVMFLAIAVVGAVLASLRLGAPDIAVLVATAAWVLFALPCNLAAGNIFSIIMPYRVNPGRITRQRGSQSNALLGLLVQLAVLGVGAAGFWIGWLLDDLWLATPIFVLLAVGAVYFWMRVLRNSGNLANNRRDQLIATLMKTD